MGSARTGDHDIALEIDDRALAAAAESQLVGSVQHFGSGANSADLLISDVKVAFTPNAPTRLTLTVSDGTVRLSGSVAEKFRAKIVLTVDFSVAPTSDTDPRASLRVASTAPGDVIFDPWAWDDFVAQMGSVTAANERLALLRLVTWFVRFDFPIPALTIDPAASGAIDVGAPRLRPPKTTTTARSMLVLGSAGPQGTLAARTRALCGPADDVGFAISPEAFRAIVCARLATHLKVSLGQLCADCGTAASTSLLAANPALREHLSRLDLTGVHITFVPGRIVIAATVSGESHGFDVDGSVSMDVSAAVVNGQLKPILGVPSVSVNVHVSAAAYFFSGGSIALLEAAAEALAETYLAGLIQKQLQAAVGSAFTLPPLGPIQPTWQRVEIDADGIAVFGTVAEASVRPLSPYAALDFTTSGVWAKVGEGQESGLTCKGGTYGYVDYDVRQTSVLVGAVTGFGAEPPVCGFQIEGQPVAVGTHTSSVSVETRRRDDAAPVVRAVSLRTRLSPDGLTLEITHTAADGDYSLDVRFVAKGPTGTYTNVATVVVDGHHRTYDDAWQKDAWACLRESIPSAPREIPWPASNGAPGWLKDKWNDQLGRLGTRFVPGRPGRPGPGPGPAWRDGPRLLRRLTTVLRLDVPFGRG